MRILESYLMRQLGVMLSISGAFSMLASEAAHAEHAQGAGFARIPKYDEARNEHEIKDMPRYRDQHRVGFCAAFAASVALDNAYCEANGIKCSDATDKDRVSVLQLSTFTETLRKKEALKDPHEIMRVAIEKRLLADEAHCSFEKLVARIPSKPGFTRDESHEMAWNKLFADWEAFASLDQRTPEAVRKFMASAITGPDGVLKNFQLNKTPDQALEAFKAAKYEETLNLLCVDEDAPFIGLELPRHLRLTYYPPEGVTGNYQATLQQVEKQIKDDIPVVISNYSVEKDLAKALKEGTGEKHGFALTGYREVRLGTEWRAMVKVHNSWGEKWQKENDGGWVDARTLFDRMAYRSQSMAWITLPDELRIISKEPVKFTAPENWKCVKGKLQDDPPTLAYMLSSPVPANAKVQIAVHSSEMEPAMTSDSLQAILREYCRPYATTPESLPLVVLKELKSSAGLGFYANFADSDLVGKPVKQGNYKTVSPMVVSLESKYLVQVTIFCDEINGAEYTSALKMIETLRIKK